jgi:hypothetical protein
MSVSSFVARNTRLAVVVSLPKTNGIVATAKLSSRA